MILAACCASIRFSPWWATRPEAPGWPKLAELRSQAKNISLFIKVWICRNFRHRNRKIPVIDTNCFVIICKITYERYCYDREALLQKWNGDLLPVAFQVTYGFLKSSEVSQFNNPRPYKRVCVDTCPGQEESCKMESLKKTHLTLSFKKNCFQFKKIWKKIRRAFLFSKRRKFF